MRYRLLRHYWGWLSIGALCLILSACATELPVRVSESDLSGTLAVGRVVTNITGKRQRIYPPELRSIEVINLENQERFRVNVQSVDEYFSLTLPPGTYEVNRVQISEGPFLSIAQLSARFVLKPNVMNFLGTWHFGVDSPKSGRQVVVSMSHNEQDQERARQFVKDTYPTLHARDSVMLIPQPSYDEARLYEVMPYPRILGYFRRHWW